jgi:alkanesulfonate monooxygenase SsuD/methylene tetrahydromethanopterin reductase-like flavin-dependent oxidoreductase (luciferase family)
MADYGRPLEFGIFPKPEAASFQEITEATLVAERLGLDLIGIQDHLYQKRYLDTLSLIASLAAKTERIRFFPDVATLPLRPPAALAKAAASIDIMSNGRFELGLGPGGYWDAIAAFGGPTRTPGEAFGALEEAIQLIRLLWSDQQSVRFEGEHYTVKGVHPGPQPAHPIEIWLGVYGPRSLRLVGRAADGWLPSIPSMPIKELNERHAIIDEAAQSAGRNPSDIRRLANVNGLITDGATNGFLNGPADQWADELTSLALEHGIDTFILWTEGDLREQTEKFAEIAALVRSGIASARG